VKVVGEIRRRRDCVHSNALDRTVWAQSERNVSVRHQASVGPAGDEGVVLEMLQRSLQRFVTIRAKPQRFLFQCDVHVAVTRSR